MDAAALDLSILRCETLLAGLRAARALLPASGSAPRLEPVFAPETVAAAVAAAAGPARVADLAQALGARRWRLDAAEQRVRSVLYSRPDLFALAGRDPATGKPVYALTPAGEALARRPGSVPASGEGPACA